MAVPADGAAAAAAANKTPHIGASDAARKLRAEHARSSASSSSSSSSSLAADSDPDIVDDRLADGSHHGSSNRKALQDTFEQRRVRHITTILLRNLVLPDTKERNKAGPSVPTIHRPRPQRSSSVLSTGSTHTLRRTPSNRTLRPRGRRRTSSVGSCYISEEEHHSRDGSHDYAHAAHVKKDKSEASSSDDYVTSRALQHPLASLLSWDLDSLQKAIHSRLVPIFVSLARAGDDTCFYRSPVSTEPGLHHQWGRAPGSAAELDGIDLTALDGDAANDEALRVSIWAKCSDGNASKSNGKDKEQVIERFVHPGEEHGLGWTLVVDCYVELKGLCKLPCDPSQRTPALPPNVLLLGLSLPLARMHSTRYADSEGDGDKALKSSHGRGGVPKKALQQQWYFIALSDTPNENASSTNSAELSSVQEGTRLSRADQRQALKAGGLARAYEVDDILRTLQLQRQLQVESRALGDIQARSDVALSGSDGIVALTLKRSEERERLRVLLAQRDVTSEKTKLARRRLTEKQEQLRRRRARLDMARRLMAAERKHFESLESRVVQMDKVRSSVDAKIYARRVALLRQLEFIYPIELVNASNLTFSIVDIPLINRDEASSHDVSKGGKGKMQQDDDTASSAFGMIAQMVALMSVYMDTPLHYPIATAGSRSVIQDGISVMSGPRAFPLFGKGVEHYRFEYGHFLLNKDIEQLMNLAGITILDIRNTLPNLKNLVVTLTASSLPNSKLSRRNHVGAEMISLQGSAAGTTALKNGETAENRQAPALQAASIGLGRSSTSRALPEGLPQQPHSRSSSRWGMSLLGWGSLAAGPAATNKGPQQVQSGGESGKRDNDSAAGEGSPAPSTHVPTVRALGKAT